MEEDGRGRYVEAKQFLHLSVRLHCYTSKQIGVQSCAGDSWRLSDNQALVIDLSLGAPLVQLVQLVDKTPTSTVRDCVHDRSTRPSTKHGLLHHATHSCLGQREETNFQLT